MEEHFQESAEPTKGSAAPDPLVNHAKSETETETTMGQIRTHLHCHSEEF